MCVWCSLHENMVIRWYLVYASGYSSPAHSMAKAPHGTRRYSKLTLLNVEGYKHSVTVCAHPRAETMPYGAGSRTVTLWSVEARG